MKDKKVTTILETQKNIKIIKDYFEKALAKKLNLTRVSAPLFVLTETGLNDNLNGFEKAITFNVLGKQAEIVHSLAKWKRFALKEYLFPLHTGLYTDMNAIRKDEDLDPIHSFYVDQWDWEYVIKHEERNVKTLQKVVSKIYHIIRDTERYMEKYTGFKPILPEEIFFITSGELENMYPNLAPKERERKICEEKGAVFISQIGKILSSGKPHDGRSPDYDDWELNGDILVWNDVLKQEFELSSMGIRVDKETLEKQLEIANATNRKEFLYHQMILKDELPYTIGGGIGQSRLCMFFLRKKHIGEVQASIWPQEMIEEGKEKGIYIL